MVLLLLLLDFRLLNLSTLGHFSNVATWRHMQLEYSTPRATFGVLLVLFRDLSGLGSFLLMHVTQHDILFISVPCAIRCCRLFQLCTAVIHHVMLIILSARCS